MVVESSVKCFRAVSISLRIVTAVSSSLFLMRPSRFRPAILQALLAKFLRGRNDFDDVQQNAVRVRRDEMPLSEVLGAEFLEEGKFLSNRCSMPWKTYPHEAESVDSFGC